MRSVYYNVYDYGRLMGRYTAPELNRLIGIPRLMVGRLADREKLYRDRYEFQRLMYAESLAEEWDRVRLQILRAAGR